MASLLTDFQIALLNWWDAGSPADAKGVIEKLGSWAMSPRQALACQELFDENVRWSRLVARVTTPTTGRGLQRLRTLLSHFEGSWATPGDDIKRIASLPLESARPVIPSRIAVCNPAGETAPEDWIDEPRRGQFLDWKGKVFEGAEQMTLPKFCHMVDKKHARELREMLLASQMTGSSSGG